MLEFAKKSGLKCVSVTLVNKVSEEEIIAGGLDAINGPAFWAAVESILDSTLRMK